MLWNDRRLRLFLVLAFLVYATHPGTAALEDDDDADNPVQRVRHEKQGKANVFIEYDLVGEPSDVYTITLTVKRKLDSTFTYTPLNVIGDIGANIRPGKNKRISWRLADEYRPELDKEDIVFAVKAIAPRSEGVSTELYIAGGAAVVGLALAIAILSSGKTEEPVNSVFPRPPGRPTR